MAFLNLGFPPQLLRAFDMIEILFSIGPPGPSSPDLPWASASVSHSFVVFSSHSFPQRLEPKAFSLTFPPGFLNFPL